MTTPEYERIPAPFPMPNLWRCRGEAGCGSVVFSLEDHTAFHEDVDPRAKEGRHGSDS